MSVQVNWKRAAAFKASDMDSVAATNFAGLGNAGNGVMLAQDGNGRLFRSTANGTPGTWSYIGHIAGITAVGANRDDQAHMLAEPGLVLAYHNINDGGVTPNWQTGVIYRSTDAGTAWTAVWQQTTGTPTAELDAVYAIIRLMDTRILAVGQFIRHGAEAATYWALIVSANNGLTWTPLDTSFNATVASTQAPKNVCQTSSGRVVLAGGITDIFYADTIETLAASWVRVALPATPKTYSSMTIFFITEISPGVLVCGGEGRVPAFGSFGASPLLWVSLDDAVTWTQVDTGAIQNSPTSGDALPSAGCTIIDGVTVIGSGYADASASDQPWRITRNGGVTWALTNSWDTTGSNSFGSPVRALVRNDLGDLLSVADRENDGAENAELIWYGTVTGLPAPAAILPLPDLTTYPVVPVRTKFCAAVVL